MKTKIQFLKIILAIFFAVNFSPVQAQITYDSTKTYLIIKNDGTQFIGKITQQDSREITIITRQLGEIIIPKHEIREIRELDEEKLTEEGKLRPSELFSTRYFINTNGLPLEKGDSYIIWNLFGPDVHFGVQENVSLGIMTTWLGSPLIGSMKISREVGKNKHLGFGALLGTGSWAALDYGIFLPFGSFTLGNAQKNLSFSAGFGASWGEEISGGRGLFSVATMNKINDRFNFVFDSFIFTGGDGDSGGALLIPGIRLQTDPNKAFQIGFAAFAADGDLLPIPLPFIQWFRKL